MSAFMPWRRNVRREIDDELRFHFDARIAELISLGVAPAAARAKAIEEFGNVDENDRYPIRQALFVKRDGLQPIAETQPGLQTLGALYRDGTIPWQDERD